MRLIKEAMKSMETAVLPLVAMESLWGLPIETFDMAGIAKDFKERIRVTALSHVRTSPHYPQSNGKLERFQGTLKRE